MRAAAQRWRGAVCLGSLCVLSGSRWLLEGAYPLCASTFASEGAACLAAALLYGLAALCIGTRRGDSSSGTLATCSGTVLVLTGAVLAQWMAGKRLGGTSASLALALVPMVVAVARPAMAQQAMGDMAASLWPGVAGLAGLLLLFPEPSFREMRPWLGLGVLPVLVGVGAVLFETGAPANQEPGVASRLWQFGAGCALAAPLFLPGAVQANRPGTIAATALDTILLLLTLEGLRRVGSSGWSAQFLLVPLLALGESVVFLRPSLSARSWVGLGLLAGGAVRQLLLPSEAVASNEEIAELGIGLRLRG